MIQIIIAVAVVLIIALTTYVLIKRADKEFDNRTPENQELLDKAYESLENHQNANELIQVAEMFRDSMEGSPAKEGLAYKVTVKAIDNYYKTAG